MTVVVREGSVLDADAQTLVNTVNCVGVMGKGVALEFKKLYPEMYREYVERCKKGEVRPGEPYLYHPVQQPSLFAEERQKWILNFPTKRHWRARSRLDDIVAGLEYLKNRYRPWSIESLAVPPLGCGHGGLDWADVKPILLDYFEQFDIPVTIYVPRSLDGTAIAANKPA